MPHTFKDFSSHLEIWFQKNGRILPWRNISDPYKVWVSEIMLQQTGVEYVKKFYERFLEKFPTLHDLARSEWEEVYRVWEGLGYYKRGQNMLQTARILVDQEKGVFPRSIPRLLSLPGIGPYTAHAILAFAFDQKVPAIDTNLKKIISVLWPEKEISQTAIALVREASSGRDWNGAMMDLSSCLRRGESIAPPLEKYFPSPVREKFLPPRKKVSSQSSKRKHLIQVGIACIHKDGKYLIQSRPEGKSFEGMWEFPGGKRLPKEDLRACVKREVREELGIEVSVRPPFFEKKHSFKKVSLLLRFHRCQIQSGTPAPQENQKIQWVAPQDFDKINFLEANHEVLEKIKAIKPN